MLKTLRSNEGCGRLTTRYIGQGLIAAGFLLAAGSGLLLAVGVGNSGGDFGGALPIAALLAAVVAGLVGLGIYVYTRAESNDRIIVNAEMLKPRELLDLLAARQSVTPREAASALGISEAEIKTSIDQLAALRVFSGYVNWDDDLLAARPAEALRGLRTCLVCESPITPHTEGQTSCPICRTIYYLPEVDHFAN
jgi:hypothetical protein